MVATATAPSETIDLVDEAIEDLASSPPSPRRIVFWIRHWAALEGIAENPRASQGEAERCRREWIMLRDERGTCLCARAVQWSSAEEAPSSSGWYGPSKRWASELKADLERAAEALPACWRVTAAIMQVMGVEMWGRWRFRYSVAHGRGGDYSQAPTLDDRPSLWDAAHAMAETLGWRRAGAQ